MARASCWNATLAAIHIPLTSNTSTITITTSSRRGSPCFASWKRDERRNSDDGNKRPPDAAIGLKKDHYGVLGINSDASPADIKLAFRRLALKYHPDVNNDFGAAEVFKRIRLAYETLSNATSRHAYDQTLRMKVNASRNSSLHYEYGSMYNRKEHHYPKRCRSSKSAKTGCTDRPGFTSERWANEDFSFSKKITDEDWPNSYARQYSEYSGTAWKAPAFMLVIFCLIGFIWYVFGVQLALTYFVFFMPHDKEHTVWYKFASVIAWLIGGTKGMVLQYGIVTTGWLCGKGQDLVLAFLLFSLWAGIHLPHGFHVPRGAILQMAYLLLSSKTSM